MDARLRRRQDFRAVLRAGRRYANRLVALYVLPRGEGPSRIGISAGRRIGPAVVRNRVRRRLREASRALGPAVEPGRDVVLIGRSEAFTAEFASLTRAVAEVFVQAGLVSGEGESGELP